VCPSLVYLLARSIYQKQELQNLAGERRRISEHARTITGGSIYRAKDCVSNAGVLSCRLTMVCIGHVAARGGDRLPFQLSVPEDCQW
jgi:hypothetical protein